MWLYNLDTLIYEEKLTVSIALLVWYMVNFYLAMCGGDLNIIYCYVSFFSTSNLCLDYQVIRIRAHYGHIGIDPLSSFFPLLLPLFMPLKYCVILIMALKLTLWSKCHECSYRRNSQVFNSAMPSYPIVKPIQTERSWEVFDPVCSIIRPLKWEDFSFHHSLHCGCCIWKMKMRLLSGSILDIIAFSNLTSLYRIPGSNLGYMSRE